MVVVNRLPGDFWEKDCSTPWCPQRRFEAIAVLAGEGLPVQLAARVLRTSESGYYRWRKHTVSVRFVLRDSGEHPVKREAVTSPAGTTIAAIRELENHAVRAAPSAALEAARDRSREREPAVGAGLTPGRLGFAGDFVA
jgi:Pyrroline-5-carboxylate reductase dimerisation